MENLIDGRRIAAEIHAETQQRVQRLRKKGISPVWYSSVWAKILHPECMLG